MTIEAISLALAFSCLVAAAYEIVDVLYPNGFVGDMYGMVKMCRLSLLFLPVAAVIVGCILVVVGSHRQNSPLKLGGLAVTMVATGCTLALAISTFHSRRLNEIHLQYPEKSVTELLRIAREKKEVPAVDALIIKKNPEAVTALGAILSDAGQDMRLRIVAAQGLGQMSSKEAKAILEQVRPTVRDGFLATAIDTALESLARAPSGM